MRSFTIDTLYLNRGEEMIGTVRTDRQDGMGYSYKYQPENRKGRDRFGVHEWIILTLVINKECVQVLTGFNWLRVGAAGGIL
jgi:hypothetical protein